MENCAEVVTGLERPALPGPLLPNVGLAIEEREKNACYTR
jgi:hypothetical protein